MLDGICNPVTSVIEGLGIKVVDSLMSCYKFTYKLESVLVHFWSGSYNLVYTPPVQDGMWRESTV